METIKTDRSTPQFIDVSKPKPIKLQMKVVVPVKEHPNFNFVGKLLGPKGLSLKRLQEETMTKMAILGKGSMRDKAKESELREGGDPKYSHLNDELHVDISAYAPAPEAYARMANALEGIKKFLVPVNEQGFSGNVLLSQRLPTLDEYYFIFFFVLYQFKINLFLYPLKSSNDVQFRRYGYFGPGPF
ncbi:KH domain-containing, RNA-binding, signal transduction-associated protein 3 [Nymphon striatum]|nr:KH domain-containing, RNA-binding, signal transduction-associated protein 3 [Nymphon striatum]